MIDEVKAAAFRQLAENAELIEVFEDLERTTFEELLRLPVTADEKAKDALIQRVQVIRDLRQRIKHFGATKIKTNNSVV